MRKLALLFVLSISVFISAQTHKVTVKVSNIKKSTGSMMIALCSSEAQFTEQERALYGKKVTVSSEIVQADFELPSGTYAVIVYHDANGNNKLDKNAFGAPKEQYGFSNNVFGVMGTKPSFEAASFRLDSKSLQVNISLK